MPFLTLLDPFKKEVCILKSEKIYIDERIRDLEYIKKNNLLVMFLETSGSISVIKKEK